MPWKETCAVEERAAFVRAWWSGEFTMSELCRRFNVSRPTGYKWVERGEAEGCQGLLDRPCAPYRHPNATAAGQVAAVGGPNDVWSADFKGQFWLGDGQRCYPLTISDNYSRYLLCCQGLSRPEGSRTRARFEAVVRGYGLPP